MTGLFFSESSRCLVKKHLSIEIYKKLVHEKTDSGYSLLNAIRSGIINKDSSIGIYAGDEMSYHTFAPVLDPVIKEYHNFSKEKKHKSDFRKITLSNPDPERRYIKSTRVRIARNIKNYSFPPHITLSQRMKLEKKIIYALNLLQGSLKGKYCSFTDSETMLENSGSSKNLKFPKGDRFQDSAGINSDFPQCRGVFQSMDGQFMVWINEEDHLRVISFKETADIAKVYNRAVTGIESLNNHLEFAWNEKYGYLTSCPTNIGTSMRAGVHIMLQNLAQEKNTLNSIVDFYNLQIRGTKGEKTKIDNCLFDISNRQRLGVSEYEIIQNLHKGIEAIIKAEKSLS